MKRTITVLFLACLLACSGLFSAFAFADAAGGDAGMPDDADQVAAVILHSKRFMTTFCWSMPATPSRVRPSGPSRKAPRLSK